MLQRAMLYNYFHNILINLNIKLTWSHSSSFFPACSYYDKLCSNLIVLVMKTSSLDRNHSEPVYTYLFWWLLAHMVLPPWRGHENSASSVPLIILTALPRTSSNFTFLNMSSQTYVECFRWGHISAYTATVMQFFSYSLGSHLGFFIIASHWCFIGYSQAFSSPQMFNGQALSLLWEVLFLICSQRSCFILLHFYYSHVIHVWLVWCSSGLRLHNFLGCH